MSNYRKHIDDFFRGKLGRYTETPPPDVWDDLDVRLDTLVPPAQPRPYHWLKHFAILSLIVVLSVSLVKKLTNDSSGPETQGEEKSLATATTAIPPAVVTGTETAPKEPEHALAHSSEKSTEATATSRSAIAVKAQIKAPTADAKFAKSPLAAKNVPSNKQGVTAMTSAKAAGSSYEHAKAARAGAGPSEEFSNNTQDVVANISPIEKNDTKTALTPDANKKEKDNIAEVNLKAATDKKKADDRLRKFELGMKLGYETGFNKDAANKYVAAPYLQYNLNSRFSLMIQPSVKCASVSTRNVGNKPQSFYRENNDSTVTQNGNSVKSVVFIGSEATDTLYTTSYTYRQSHDSIVKSFTYGGSYLEFELPVMLKYNLTKKTAIYGGVNVAYSQLMTVKEQLNVTKGIVRSEERTNTTNDAPGHLPVNSVIQYSGTRYSNNSETIGTATPENNVRLGYMMGVSYTCGQRWMLDALMQQTPVKSQPQQGYNINNTLAAPYFRLSVGYRIIK